MILYVPLAVLAATVTIPLASMLSGPVVNDVTLVLVVVAATPFNVSFVKVFKAVTIVLFDTTVTDGSSTASIGFKTTIVAIALLQFAGTTLNPVEGLTSHNS